MIVSFADWTQPRLTREETPDGLSTLTDLRDYLWWAVQTQPTMGGTATGVGAELYEMEKQRRV